MLISLNSCFKFLHWALSLQTLSAITASKHFLLFYALNPYLKWLSLAPHFSFCIALSPASKHFHYFHILFSSLSLFCALLFLFCIFVSSSYMLICSCHHNLEHKYFDLLIRRGFVDVFLRKEIVIFGLPDENDFELPNRENFPQFCPKEIHIKFLS